jgi:G patch domain-containing protein 1
MLRYFNTVGSKEGWAPKTFVSSRASRNKDQPNGQAQRAEDFMDEEDLAQAAESRQLETAQSFAAIGDSAAQIEDGLFGLFLTQEETMGVKIAQKMGWRRDQGIGRKVRRTARLEDGAPGDSAAHLFAPEDARAMPILREEVRRKGLGFQSEVRLGVVAEKEADHSPTPDLHFLEGSKKASAGKKSSVKKSSFGVGILNDTGSDDEDPYELGPKIIFNKTLGKKPKKPSKFAKAGVSDMPVFVSKKETSKALAISSRRSIDGKPPLPGFTLATGIVGLASKPKYPAPTIPPGWKSSKGAPAADSTAFQSVADAAKASTLDAKARSALLGEKPLPGKSVFDFIPKGARDRLADLSGNAHLPQGLGQAGPEGHLPAATAQPKDLWSLVPTLEKAIAAGALARGATGWMPYAEDPEKRVRYVGFLELRAGLTDDLPARRPGVSISDWTKELQEFAHAAEVFKPTTGIMASRFTSSTTSTLPQPQSGADVPQQNLHVPVAKPEDPAESAAKLGMYGAMTRSSFPFHPSRLLCKRFNVKAPLDIPATSDTGENGFKSQTEEAVSKSAMEKMVHQMLTNGPPLQRPAWMGQAAEAPATEMAQSVEHATVDVESNEALSNERAPEDVFKAIFGDDDDDE